MPWKFVIFILICIIFSLFVAVNLENKTDISFVFASISQVPIFLVVLLSFAAGAGAGLLAIIFTKSKKRKIEKTDTKKKKAQETEIQQQPEETRHGRKKR